MSLYRKCEWLLCGMCYAPSQSDEYYLNYLDKALWHLQQIQEGFPWWRFQKEIEHSLKCFFYQHELSNLVKETAYFKNMQNPSCIGILLTNNSYAFQQTTTVSSGLSDCDKLKTSVY